MTDTEIIVRRTNGYVEVIQDGRTTGPMSMGEVLEQVIALIYSEGTKHMLQAYRMQTNEEWQNYRRRVAAEESIDEVYRD